MTPCFLRQLFPLRHDPRAGFHEADIAVKGRGGGVVDRGDVGVLREGRGRGGERAVQVEGVGGDDVDSAGAEDVGEGAAAEWGGRWCGEFGGAWWSVGGVKGGGWWGERRGRYLLVWESACGCCCCCCDAGLAHVEGTFVVVVMTFLYVSVDCRRRK